MTFGGLHAAEIASGGFRSVDVTGLIALVTGIGAIVVAVSVLWRSRRNGSRARRYARRALIAAGTLIAAFYVVVPILFAVGITDQPRTRVETADLGRPYENVRLRTADGLILAGSYIPSRNGAAVIALPGRRDPVPHARMLARHGFGVLLVDLRGTGGSYGDPNAFGWGAGADVEAAIEFLTHRPDVHQGAIGGLGLSVGGELLLQTAASDSRLQAVVSEGAGYRTLQEEMKQKGIGTLLTVPQNAVLFGSLRVLASAKPPKPLYALVGRIAPRPILLIEAGHGQGGEQLNSLYYRRAAEPKTLWRIPEAHHHGGLEARPAEYEQRVVGFFGRALLEPRNS